MIEARELFDSLSFAGPPPLQVDEGKFVETGIFNTGGAITAFVDTSGGFGLFIPFGLKDPEFISPDLKSPNITLKTVRWRGEATAQLRLEDKSFVSVFYAFVDQFIREITSNPESAVLVSASQLRRWRSLFTPSINRGLSTAEELGLVCELAALEELIHSDGDLAFYRWTGPAEQRHDFRFPDRSIECKATQISKGLTVSISSTDQLAAEPDQPLLLNVRKYEESPNGTVSLPNLVSELASDPRLPGDEFLSVLRDKGFSLNEESTGQYRTFYEIENHVFEVGELFPRITSTGLSDRIVSVNYSLDLTDPEAISGYRKDNSLTL